LLRIFSSSFGRTARYPGPPELPYLAALSLHLTSHVLDLGANDIDVRHRSDPSSATGLEQKVNEMQAARSGCIVLAVVGRFS
jgi:hypothetical protein